MISLATKNLSTLIGKSLKDENGREIGKVVSFIMNPSGEAKEVLVENKSGVFVKYPIEKLKTDQGEILLTSNLERRVERFCERFPMLLKKREILSALFKNKKILPEIYDDLSAEFDRSIDEMRIEAQNLLNDIEHKVQSHERFIKMLHLARAYLEMEHGIGNVKEEVFRQSLLSILREIKYASYRRTNLLKVKDKVADVILQSDKKGLEGFEEKDLTASSPVDQKPIINVRITDE